MKVVPVEVLKFGFTSTSPAKVNELSFAARAFVARVIVLSVPLIFGTLKAIVVPCSVWTLVLPGAAAAASSSPRIIDAEPDAIVL